MLSDERLRVWEGSVSAGRDDMESVTVSSGAWRQLIYQAREANALRAEVERLRVAERAINAILAHDDPEATNLHEKYHEMQDAIRAWEGAR